MGRNANPPLIRWLLFFLSYIPRTCASTQSSHEQSVRGPVPQTGLWHRKRVTHITENTKLLSLVLHMAEVLKKGMQATLTYPTS